MSGKSKTCSAPWPASRRPMRLRRRPAMTLVEVVAALALLGTLLAAVLVVRVRYARQSAAAERRLQAVAAADALLSAWHRDPRSLPRFGSGQVAGDAQLAWRTAVVPN